MLDFFEVSPDTKLPLSGFELVAFAKLPFHPPTSQLPFPAAAAGRALVLLPFSPSLTDTPCPRPDTGTSPIPRPVPSGGCPQPPCAGVFTPPSTDSALLARSPRQMERCPHPGAWPGNPKAANTDSPSCPRMLTAFSGRKTNVSNKARPLLGRTRLFAYIC